ncbi:MAG: SgcJ/EcaC family oxidoreductase [Myxococcota bacterium]
MSGWWLVASAFAQDPHDALRRVKADLERAMNARDLDGILAHAHPDVVFTTMNGDVARGREGVRAYFAKMMTDPGHVVASIDARFDADELSILHGGDTAVSWGTSRGHYVLTDGTAFDVDARWSATLVQTDADPPDWTVASFHYSTDLWDNPVLAATQRWAAIGAGLAGVLGVALGTALGFVFGRRR